jgi:hypothetical protein
MSVCEAIRIRRRSTMSASAPAGSASSSNGRVPEAAIRPTHSGEPVSSSISQEAATVCRNEPMLENTDASHSTRKRRMRRGAVGLVDTPHPRTARARFGRLRHDLSVGA